METSGLHETHKSVLLEEPYLLTWDNQRVTNTGHRDVCCSTDISILKLSSMFANKFLPEGQYGFYNALGLLLRSYLATCPSTDGS
ncbi:MAG: hypothetical protein AAFX87_28555 [Bacteroidota bacterium]